MCAQQPSPALQYDLHYAQYTPTDLHTKSAKKKRKGKRVREKNGLLCIPRTLLEDDIPAHTHTHKTSHPFHPVSGTPPYLWMGGVN